MCSRIGCAEHQRSLTLRVCAGHGVVVLQACRALVAAGADLLRRNGKNRIPGSQLKVGSLVVALAHLILLYLMKPALNAAGPFRKLVLLGVGHVARQRG
jgi:hypothetical protein